MKRTSRASFRPKTWQSSLHVVLALLCLRAAPAVSAIDTLVVLHTNDFHGYISPDGDRAAGLARIATYFDRERARFRLVSVHPCHTVEDVRNNTGFDFDVDDNMHETGPPDAETLALIRGPVAKSIANPYPSFARDVFGI